MTAPLLPIPHNWVDQVTHERTWPTAVLGARDGAEQRLARAVAPRQRLRYTLTVTSADELLAVLAPVLDAAAGSDGTTRRQVRVPRWEDAVMLTAPASAGATTLAVDEDATLRAFADGGEVALWIPGGTVDTATLAASGAVATSSLTLASGLAADWPAGTRVVPVSTARLTEALDWTRDTATLTGGALEVVLDDDVAGASAADAPGDPGYAEAPVVVTMSLHDAPGNASAGLAVGQQLQLRARCYDVNGAAIPSPAALVWSNLPTFGATARVVDADAGILILTGIAHGSLGTFGVRATDPVSGVFAIFNVIIS